MHHHHYHHHDHPLDCFFFLSIKFSLIFHRVLLFCYDRSKSSDETHVEPDKRSFTIQGHWPSSHASIYRLPSPHPWLRVGRTDSKLVGEGKPLATPQITGPHPILTWVVISLSLSLIYKKKNLSGRSGGAGATAAAIECIRDSGSEIQGSTPLSLSLSLSIIITDLVPQPTSLLSPSKERSKETSRRRRRDRTGQQREIEVGW